MLIAITNSVDDLILGFAMNLAALRGAFTRIIRALLPSLLGALRFALLGFLRVFNAEVSFRHVLANFGGVVDGIFQSNFLLQFAGFFGYDATGSGMTFGRDLLEGGFGLF